MSQNNTFSKYTQYISLGAEIAAAILLPIVLGYWLDDYFNSSPWLVLAGCLIGIVNVMIVIFRLADRLNNQK
ncbi:AtpZ/AtpI family protein [Halalkalibaculum sp. DA3122]|uniref:AtpZ/AtpI family protein n=1 Tax=unclassified Halalkalibaculum TaxID=2964617 RepID=UPI003753F475